MLRSQMKHVPMADAPRCVERKESPDLVSHNLALLLKDCFFNSCGAKYWKGSQKGRSSTACSVGVVLHRRQKLYFIVKGSSTAPKGTKTVFSFRHPKPPQKQQKCLGYPKKASRAHYIYNESVEKFHFILKKVVPMLVKRPKPMYLCNRKQGGTLLKRVPLRFAPRKGRVL